MINRSETAIKNKANEMLDVHKHDSFVECRDTQTGAVRNYKSRVADRLALKGVVEPARKSFGFTHIPDEKWPFPNKGAV